MAIITVPVVPRLTKLSRQFWRHLAIGCSWYFGIFRSICRQRHITRLNVNQFLQEIADDRHVARIQADRLQGQHDGVQSLPACFINQQRFEGCWDELELIQAIQRLLDIDRERIT
jgi:hypothetical protein